MGNSIMGNRKVKLEWDDGSSSEFHYIWLRDNCACDECKHPDAWERLLDNVELNLDIRPTHLEFGDALEVEWDDGHQTSLSADWLRKNAMAGTGEMLVERHQLCGTPG